MLCRYAPRQQVYKERCLWGIGVDNFAEYGYYYQIQAMATPTPLPPAIPDPLLIHWTRAQQNPIIPAVPTGGNHSQFRDPMTTWQQVWHMLQACVVAFP